MQVLSAPLVSKGPPSPTLTNPDMILPFENAPIGEISTVPPLGLPPPISSMDDGRLAKSDSMDNQARMQKAKQSLSPFRNGLLAHSDGPSMLRRNSLRGHGRIKLENSRLSFRPNGQESKGASPPLLADSNPTGMDRLVESPETEDGPSHQTYTAPSILDEDEDDPESHAAMTRRAEEILASAKKRLGNMDRNLYRARSTLGSRPSSSMSSFANRDPPYQRDRFSRLKHRQLNLALQEDRQGHSRVSSETSVPSSLQSPAKTQTQSQNGTNGDRSSDRNWFWNGLGRSTSLADKNSRGLQPLKEDGPALNSFERQAIQGEDDDEVQRDVHERQRDASADDTSHISPAHGLSRSRSTTQMRDLRDQMTDLKGKISTLRQRAREDSLRRRSMQSLRTPSPLNNAEVDYSKIPRAESQNRATGLDPAADVQEPTRVFGPGIAGMQASPQASPTSEYEPQVGHEESSPDESSGVSFSEHPMQAITTVNGQPAAPAHEAMQDVEDIELKGYPGHQQQDAMFERDSQVDAEAAETKASGTEEERAEDTILLSSKDINSDSEENELYEEPVGERHEDRADAFDYEHFFLHSSMGHYGRKRSSTHSSNVSTETERPPTMSVDSSAGEGDGSPHAHVRKGSTSSISTVATFTTATEGGENETKEEEETWIPRQTVAGAWLVDPPVVEVNGKKRDSPKARTPKTAGTKQEKSAKRHRREHSVTDDGVNAPVAEIPDLMAHMKAILSKESGQDLDLTLIESDKELAERVMSSLAKVCLDLHSLGAEGGTYEARVCRRKLDIARRQLDGEVNGEAF